jgi:hypothetical protein
MERKGLVDVVFLVCCRIRAMVRGTVWLTGRNVWRLPLLNVGDGLGTLLKILMGDGTVCNQF